MSNRDGRTAQKNTRNREYWSRRLPGCWSWGKIGKWMTHRRERAERRRIERQERKRSATL